MSFQPSQVSGVETILAEADGFTPASTDIRVEILGLQPLPEDPTRYVLVGAPQNHAGTNDPCRQVPPNSPHGLNHFGHSVLNANVRDIAARMLAQSGILLRVNDMSLAMGGLFDIKPQKPWQPPHDGHRQGNEADVGYDGVRGGACAPHDLARLRETIIDVTKRVPLHYSDHFHIFRRQ